MEKLLELARKKADWAEVFYIDREYNSVNFKNGELYNIEGENEKGVTLRVRKDGKTGFTSSTGLQNRETIVETAMNILSVSEKSPFKIPSYKESDYPCVECLDEKLVNLSEKDLLEAGKEVIETVKKEKPSVPLLAETGKTKSKFRIINTSGTDKSYERSLYSVTLFGSLVFDDDQLEIESYFTSGNYVKDLRPFARKMVEDIKNSEHTVELESGPMNVIFIQRGFKTIFPPLFTGFSGATIGNNTSPLCGRQGEQIGPEFLTVVDDNTLPYGPLSGPVDDEGVPAKRIELIKNGRVNAFYYDLKKAAMYNTESTGNGIKRTSLYEGFKLISEPGCHLSNFMVMPGDKNREELMKGVERALIVEDVLGAGQANNLSGEFRVNVLMAYLWENGEVKGRVKDVMISGNVFKMLKNLMWVASDSLWEHSFFGIYNVPTMCFSDVNVFVK